VRRVVAAIARFLTRISQPPVILQVHIGDGDYFQIAQKRFDREADAGEKLAWASAMVGFAQNNGIPGAKMLGLFSPTDHEFVHVARPHPDTFEPIFLTTL
jgi:hypothetical protein